MKKVIKITESQLNTLVERKAVDYSAIDIANILKGIECTGESIKSIINKKLSDSGFENIEIKFLGYGDNKKILRYIVHTEGPVFTIDTMSNSESNPPCMDVVDVVAYTKA